ncbi:hypothetical protein ABEB36_004812 [Hypothenemus hampei]|uniref:Secreted protein n=1 Tax=Hypothenemus hampei TaxID=57062 RepID=A0ABD1EVX4_HYPHA
MKTVFAAAAATAALCVVCVIATPPQPFRDIFRGWKKRLDHQKLPTKLNEDIPAGAASSSSDFQQHIPQLSLASSQLMLRAPRGQRQYDVPQIDTDDDNCRSESYFFLIE